MEIYTIAREKKLIWQQGASIWHDVTIQSTRLGKDEKTFSSMLFDYGYYSIIAEGINCCYLLMLK